MEEKPLECSHCKKKNVICFKEVSGRKVQKIHMCAECPLLAEKWGEGTSQCPQTTGQHIACKVCGTQSTEFLRGESLGCPQCYIAFEQILMQKLRDSGLLPKEIDLPREYSLHIGKKPLSTNKRALSKRLKTLNYALDKALAGENYETAAFLRDQIKTIMDKTDEK